MNRKLLIKEKLKFGSPFYSDILNSVFIIYAFLLPFSKAFSIFTGPYVILLFWILEGNFTEKFEKIKSSKVILYILLFFAFNVLSLLWSDNIEEGRKLLRYYFAISMVLIAIYTSMKQRFSKSILYAFLLSMFISEIASYGIYFGWWHMEGSSPAMPTPFMHHTIYSVFLAITIFLLLGQLGDKNVSWKIKIFELLFLLSSSINLFINGGRTGQLALVLGALTYTVVYFKKKIYLLYTLFFVSIVFLTAYQLSPNFHSRVHQGIHDIQKIQNGNLQTSWGSRIAIKIVTYDIFKDHPIIGTGIGDAMDIYTEYLKKNKFEKLQFTYKMDHLHDQYIQILIQTGIIGLILFFFFLFSLLKIVLNISNKMVRASMCSIFVVFIFSFFTDVPLINFTVGLFAFVMGYLLNWEYYEKTKTK